MDAATVEAPAWIRAIGSFLQLIGDQIWQTVVWLFSIYTGNADPSAFVGLTAVIGGILLIQLAASKGW